MVTRQHRVGGKIPSPAGTLGEGQHSLLLLQLATFQTAQGLLGDGGNPRQAGRGPKAHKPRPHFSASSDLLGGAPDGGCPGLAHLQLHPVP